eukprot:TRINITY_DN4828_c1_g1_i2.p1 TRINITY_DN4828_c1_g1~~TRINITY_DN4828_c1_g1_i2.p1  ORF type:complete len:303 (+),score=73.25 TRINITY_DN4828_c1_g1_i2:90-911(+)
MSMFKPHHLVRTAQHIRYACTNSLNSVHHATGSKMPEVDPAKLTLLNMRFCPYAQRTVLCLNAKDIDYEVINCALMTKPEWLWDLNPIGKVPVMLHEGNILYESLITCDYVDEAFPGRPLHSNDPATKAKDKMLVELFNRVVMPQMKIWFGWKRGQGEEDRAAHWAECMQNLVRFETELGQRQTAFFGGQDFPGWLDYMIWPWMERINIYPLVFKGETQLTYQSVKFPLLNTWMSKMKEDPAVVEYFLDDDTHAGFVKTIVTGTPNYDFLLNQ